MAEKNIESNKKSNNLRSQLNKSLETSIPLPKLKQDTISNMTKDQNWQINQMVLPDQLHYLRPLTGKKSCRDILTQTGREIQQMNEILKRLLPEDDRHTIINSPTKIEVIPDCLMTFKIPSFQKNAPCKLFFSYFNQSSSYDLMVYVSREES